MVLEVFQLIKRKGVIIIPIFLCAGAGEMEELKSLWNP